MTPLAGWRRPWTWMTDDAALAAASANSLEKSVSMEQSSRSRCRARIAHPGRSLIGRATVGAKVLVEEIDGSLPRQLGCRLVIAWCRVVVEAVIGAGVHELLVLLAVRLQRRLICGPSRVDAIVEAAVVNHQRSVDPRDVLGLGLAAIVRRRAGE